MARILGIGTATLDLIDVVEAYPREDDEIRALARRRARGGNAANTLVVLSQLGHACAWAGVLGDDAEAEFVKQDLARHGVDASRCRVVRGGRTPVSHIVLSRRSGSRTIVHFRDLSEFSYTDFERIDITGFDWLHFEGRNVAETRRMLERARTHCPRAPRSIEVEKPRPQIETLFDPCEVILFSKTYALSRGFAAPEAFLRAMRSRTTAPVLVCSWGRQGACGLKDEGDIVFSPARPPTRVIDTLGAGDTFNAGFIDAWLAGIDLAAALEAACRLAGRKCGQEGFAGLIA